MLIFNEKSLRYRTLMRICFVICFVVNNIFSQSNKLRFQDFGIETGISSVVTHFGISARLYGGKIEYIPRVTFQYCQGSPVTWHIYEDAFLDYHLRIVRPILKAKNIQVKLGGGIKYIHAFQSNYKEDSAQPGLVLDDYSDANSGGYIFTAGECAIADRLSGWIALTNTFKWEYQLIYSTGSHPWRWEIGLERHYIGLDRSRIRSILPRVWYMIFDKIETKNLYCLRLMT